MIAHPTVTAARLLSLAALVQTIRPEWDTAGILAALRTCGHRPLPLLSLASVQLALDPQTLTPNRLSQAGPWWPAEPAPVRRPELRSVSELPPLPPADPERTKRGLALARAALASARERRRNAGTS